MYYAHPKVIPWGQTNKQPDKWRDGQTDGQTNGQIIFTQYSGISSHSLEETCFAVYNESHFSFLLDEKGKKIK
jgi:hypothetical protein